MILFCAADAGGARELIPVIDQAKAQSLLHVVVSSPVTEPLFTRAGIATHDGNVDSIETAKDVLESVGARTVITGTTGTPKADRYFTAAAKQINAKSIAVLDEWYNYRLRFEEDDGTMDAYLPDLICCQDEKSKELAMEEGIPEERLRITGSPALARLQEDASALKQNPPPEPSQWKDTQARILFLSEPLRAAYGDAEGERGTHGAFLGFHEEIVREDIADIAERIEDVHIIEKLHPSEELKDPPVNAPEGMWTVLPGSDTLIPLLWHADQIIGMYSKTLLEAAVLGRHPISYQPNTKDSQKCTAVRLGLIECVESKDQLEKLLSEKGAKAREPLDLACADPKGAANILELTL